MEINQLSNRVPSPSIAVVVLGPHRHAIEQASRRSRGGRLSEELSAPLRRSCPVSPCRARAPRGPRRATRPAPRRAAAGAVEPRQRRGAAARFLFWRGSSPFCSTRPRPRAALRTAVCIARSASFSAAAEALGELPGRQRAASIVVSAVRSRVCSRVRPRVGTRGDGGGVARAATLSTRVV